MFSIISGWRVNLGRIDFKVKVILFNDLVKQIFLPVNNPENPFLATMFFIITQVDEGIETKY